MARPARPWYWSARGGWYVTVGSRRRLLAKGPKRKTKNEAEREFYLLMLAEGRSAPTDRGSLTLRGLVNLFLGKVKLAVTRGEREQGTYDTYEKYLVSAIKSAGDVKASGIGMAQLNAWVDGKPWGPTVRHNALNAVKIAYRWARKNGHLAVNPIADMDLPRPKKRTKIPTAKQVEAIFGAAWGQPFRDFLTALRETGARPSEVRSLTADKVDLEAGIWTVKNKTRTATGEEYRPVYLTPAAIELTRRRLQAFPEGLVFRNSRGEPWKKGAIAYRFIRLQAKLGYGPECSAYAFRHLFVTDALERGVNPAVVAELVGHRDLTMIMRVYNQLKQRTDHLREAVRQARPEAASARSGP
jgi:integrase